MARLQDFNTVTPTSADKLLVVQSQGQGLVPYGSKLDSANPTGSGSLSLNRKANTTTGTESVAVGHGCTASGAYSFAEGETTTATGEAAHAEGYNNTSSGTASHAEGSGNTASGNRAHAEGYNCVASGNYSHAQGNGTIANHLGQTALGAFNLEDGTADAGSRGTYIEIVGKGTSASNRSNARTLDWNGNEVLAGDLTVMGSLGVAKIKEIAAPSSNVSKLKIATSGTESKCLIIIENTNVLSDYKAFGYLGNYAANRAYFLPIYTGSNITIDQTHTQDNPAYIEFSFSQKSNFSVTLVLLSGTMPNITFTETP